MMRRLWPGFLALALVAISIAGCRSRNASSTADSVQPSAEQADNQGAKMQAAPGKFDFYLFSLTWTPEFCHDHRSSAECGGSHRGFVIHGLWPQNYDGTWPQSCSTAAGLADPSQMLDLMPDVELISHEWQKHGTCTGMTAAQYFDTIRHEWETIHIPPMFVSNVPVRADAGEIKRAFTEANPSLPASAVAVQCHNRYLAGVQICLDKQLSPTSCKAVRDCDLQDIKIPALEQ